VPPPHAQLTRFHGVFALKANLRGQLTPSGRGKRPPTDESSTGANSDHRSPDEKRRSMTWAQRLKRVLLRASCPPTFGPAFRLFQIAPGDLVNIDVSTCGHCGGAVRIVASIEEPTAIRTIRAHFEKHGALEKAHYRPAPRAPPAVAACRSAGHDAEGETRQDQTKRQRSRSAVLGPLPGISEKWPRTALSNTHQPAQTLCNGAQTTAKPRQTHACTASDYRAA